MLTAHNSSDQYTVSVTKLLVSEQLMHPGPEVRRDRECAIT